MNEQTLRTALGGLTIIQSTAPGSSTNMRQLLLPCLQRFTINENTIEDTELAHIVTECLDEADGYWLDSL